MEPISPLSSLARAMTSSGKTSLASSARAGHSNNAATYCKKKTYTFRSVGRGAKRQCKGQQAPKRCAPPYLAVECDRRLIKPGLLRVPDVRGDDLVERQVMGGVRLELHPVFLGFDGQLTAHGILDVENRGIQRIDCERHVVSAAAERAEEKNFPGATRP